MSLHHHEVEEGKDSLQAMVPDKKNQVRWMVSMVIAIVIIIAGALLISGNLVKMVNPGAYVVGAASHTAKTISKEQEAVKKLPIYTVMETHQDKPLERQANFSVTQLPDSLREYDFLTNIGLSFDVKSDMKGKKALAELEAQYANTSLFSASILADDNILSLNVPALMNDTYYGMDTSTWVEAYNASVFAENGGPLPFGEDANFNVFDRADFYQPKNQEEALEMYLTKETVEQNKKLQKELFKSIQFKNAGKEITQVNGRNLSCSKVTAVVTKEALLKYVTNAYNLLKADEKFADYMEASVFSQAIASGMSPKQMMEQVWMVYDEMLDTMNSTLNQSLDENINCVFYVNNKNLVKLTADSVLTFLEEGVVPVHLNIQIGGEKYLSDHLYGELKGESKTMDFNISLDTKGNHTGADGAFNSDTKVTVNATDPFSGEQAKVEATVAMNYDSKATENNAGWTYGINLTENGLSQDFFMMTAQGTLLADQSTGVVSGDFGDILLSILGENFSLEADWSIQPLKVTEETFPQVEPIMVYSMTEEEVNEAVENMLYTGMSYFGGLMSTGKFDDLAPLVLG